MARAKTMAAVVTVAAIVGSALSLAAPASADPATDPCQPGVTFLCHFLPMAPELSHDIDLTQGSVTLNGAQLPEMPTGSDPSDDGVPANPCLLGCN